MHSREISYKIDGGCSIMERENFFLLEESARLSSLWWIHTTTTKKVIASDVRYGTR